MKRAAVAFACSAIANGACHDTDPPPAPTTLDVAHYAAVPSRKLDILFQIDGSNGGEVAQANLAATFDELLAMLSTIDGGLPDLHVGVISSDLGTSGSIGEPALAVGSLGQGGCAARGDDGALLTNGAPISDTFLVDLDGGGFRQRNFTGEITDVFRRMVQIGVGDCGFEQPLAATLRAFQNPANAGFSRPDGNLLVVIATDEDDCSVRDPSVFGPDSAELGTRSSFRCTRFGLVCDEPLDGIGAKTNCRAREDSPYVDGITPFVDVMRTVRGPGRVAIAAIAGPPSVALELRSPPNGGPGELGLAHSCSLDTQTGRNVADPAVRIAGVIDALAPNSSFTSICASLDFTPTMAAIARTARKLYGITCLDPAHVGDEPTCAVTVQSAAELIQLPPCPAEGDCFEIVEDTAACGDLPRLAVHLAAPSPDQYVRARCSRSE